MSPPVFFTLGFAMVLALPGVRGAGTFQRVLLTEAAQTSGAVCLDGTPAAYYVHKGSGAGASKWLIFHEGGGWCPDVENCAQRALSNLGSSKNYPENTTNTGEGFEGIMSPLAVENPLFYNWNLVYAKYCDGTSFAADLANPVQVGNQTLYFRGHRIWEALMVDLDRRGMSGATEAVLAGCSAGGTATYLHCDAFAGRFSTDTTKVRCVADAGYMPDFNSTKPGYNRLREMFGGVVTMGNVTASGMNAACVASRPLATQWFCFFPQYMLPYLKTPIFALNSGYDSWQFKGVWFAGDANYSNCTARFPSGCSTAQLAIIQQYHQRYLKVLHPITDTDSPHGAYIDSCYRHCQTGTWNTGVRLSNMTKAEAVRQWYLGSTVKLIDVPFPGDTSCGAR